MSVWDTSWEPFTPLDTQDKEDSQLAMFDRCFVGSDKTVNQGAYVWLLMLK